jgi:hypothetical protein
MRGNISSLTNAKKNEPTESIQNRVNALTIPQAKAGLAATFGVDPDNIKILIRG